MTRKLFATLCSILLWCACSHEADFLSPRDEEAKVRLSVTIVAPAAPDTRSATLPDGTADGGTSEGTQEGTDAENHIADAAVVLATLPVGAIQPSIIRSVHKINRLYSISVHDHRWVGEIEALPGNYRLLVVANFTDAVYTQLQALEGKPWHDAIQAVVKAADYDELSAVWQDNRFMMTNAYNGVIHTGDVTLEKNADNRVTIPVQRVSARFDYQPAKAGNTYTPEAEQATVSVTLTHAGLMNIGRGYHLFKQVCAGPNDRQPTHYAYEHATNYVFDADWTEKLSYAPAQTPDLFFYPSESATSAESVTSAESASSAETASSAESTDVSDNTPRYVELPAPSSDTEAGKASYSRLFYASENTLPGIEKQIHSLTTTVVFKGYFTWTEQGDAQELYYIENSKPLQLYATLSQLKQDNPSFTVEDNADDPALAKAGIRRYRADGEGRFPVYYTYRNRHNDNRNPIQMGVMEFAVVRNNIYKLRVNSINFLGNPQDPTAPGNPWKPDGNTPDEQEARLDVTVTVAPWVDRTYDFEI